ncbi:uncharacterized protein RCH25_036108 [Pelodytes ibericus]
MAPWWPGTALLSTKAPRKLVFLFTLSLSVTYLFYSLLSCYSSLQFPLQDAGVFLQPEPGNSPEGTVRTSSLKPEALRREILFVPEAQTSQRSSINTVERKSHKNSTCSQRSQISSARRAQVTPSQARLGITITDRSSGAPLPPYTVSDLGNSGSSHSEQSGIGSSRQHPSALSSFTSFSRRGDVVPEPGVSMFSAATGKASASGLGARIHPTALRFSTLDSAAKRHTPRTATSPYLPLLVSAPRTATSPYLPTSDISPSLLSSAPRISHSDSASTLHPALEVRTLDSDPQSYSAQREGYLNSDPTLSSTVEFIAPVHSLQGGINTLESAPLPSLAVDISPFDRDSVPFSEAPLSPQEKNPISSTVSPSSSLNTPDHILSHPPGTRSGVNTGKRYITTASATDLSFHNTSKSWQDYSATGSLSQTLPENIYSKVRDTRRVPTKAYPGISGSGETSGSPKSTGNDSQRDISSWARTPLTSTEMIPESQTGFGEREPQESSTPEDELSRRTFINSTAEYGDKRLPQAIIIGVKKGGTRALLEALRAHPDVRAVGVEPHFFDRNYEKGLEWYRDLMPRTVDGQITMEKTPSYFVTNEAPQRIHSMAKDTKLIVVVRNPVTRAISDYTQTLSKKPEIPTFEVLAFKNRTLGLIDASWSALRIGIYALHLESWMQYFPLSQILFVSGESLISNPAEELAKVQEFLGLRRIITDKHFHFNKTKGFPCLKKPEDTGAPRCLGKSKGRTHPKIDPDVIQRLRKFYKPFNAMFYQMTGQDFQWEKEVLES